MGWTLRVGKRFLLHRPAGGLERSAKLDRVLEIRFAKLQKELAIAPTVAGGGLCMIGFAYSAEELAGVLEAHAVEGPWPPEMAAVIADCTTKLQRGEGTVASIREWLEGFVPSVSGDWPATIVEGLLPSHPHRALAASLIGEACAAIQERPFERAVHGVRVAHALITLQDLTLAEAELVRIGDLARGRLTLAEEQILDRLIRWVWLEVHANSGNNDAFAPLLQECLEDAGDGTRAGRLMRAQALGLSALLVFRRGAPHLGFQTFASVVAELYALFEEVSA
jgi:hypothetical protein